MNRCPVARASASHEAPARPTAPLRIEDLPGPRGWPWIGNALQLESNATHRTLEAWQARYGDRYRFRVGSRTFVVISDPDAIRTVLRDRPEGFQRSKHLVDVFSEMGPLGLFASNGDAWVAQRSLVMRAFDPAHLRGYFPTMVQVTGRLLERWRRAAARREEIDLLADLTRYTVDVVAGLALGTDINTIEECGPTVQAHLDVVSPTVQRRLFALFPYWRYLKFPADHAFDRHARELDRMVTGLIAEARQRLADEPDRREHPTNLIESLVCARDHEGSRFTDRDVAGNVLTILLAGEDTTAHSLAWMVRLLAREPGAWQRAHEEVKQVVGDASFPSAYAQIERLGYLDACAHETMRLKPVAPVQGHQAVQPTVVDGIEIPAGTVVMCLVRPAAVDVHRWPDAARFAPERWLQDAAHEANAVQGASIRRISVPFGGGPRICPGRQLALLEIRMAAAMLLRNFRVEELDAPRECDGEHFAFTMRPRSLRVRLVPLN